MERSIGMGRVSLENDGVLPGHYRSGTSNNRDQVSFNSGSLSFPDQTTGYISPPCRSRPIGSGHSTGRKITSECTCSLRVGTLLSVRRGVLLTCWSPLSSLGPVGDRSGGVTGTPLPTQKIKKEGSTRSVESIDLFRSRTEQERCPPHG